MSASLFSPYICGPIHMKNRVVMAPMTRSRCDNEEHTVTPMVGTYYKQRASAGLMISEGTQVSPRAVGYINTPGIYSKMQVESWRHVTESVHAHDGKIFAQLWHVGRVSHSDHLNGLPPLAPSAINSEGKSFTKNGFVKTSTPEAMTVAQIKATQQDFVQAAKNALEAGFDGVELHAANGYLFHQFFTLCSNTRTDEYGGSHDNRMRFLTEMLDEFDAAGIDLQRVGVRLNPSAHHYHGIEVGTDTIPMFEAIVKRLNTYNLCYLHLCEPFTDVSNVPHAEPHIARRFRPLYDGVLMLSLIHI